MDEQDYKYLITTYQQKIFDILSQLIASEARVKKLVDTIEALNLRNKQQQEELDKLSQKPKRNTKAEAEFE